MERYRLKQVIIEAEQWFNVGDVKGITSYKEADKSYDSIGSIDSYAEIITMKEYLKQQCLTCKQMYGDHGLMKTEKMGFIRVCPGEWLTKHKDGIHDPIPEKHFRETYELDV